jgi:hypothetical protein
MQRYLASKRPRIPTIAHLPQTTQRSPFADAVAIALIPRASQATLGPPYGTDGRGEHLPRSTANLARLRLPAWNKRRRGTSAAEGVQGAEGSEGYLRTLHPQVIVSTRRCSGYA